MIRTLIAWGPAAIWAAVLFFLSGLSSDSVSSWVAEYDKVVHFLLYAVLGTALAWGGCWLRGPAPHWILLALGALYGLSDEWHQSFVPGRHSSALDVVADLAGTVSGYVVATLLFTWLLRRLFAQTS